jgi:RimJ/RimL family protein N-acetyltransferase
MSTPKITIAETRDAELLDRIMRLPEVYDAMIFDGGIPRGQITTRELVKDARNHFVLVCAQRQPAGFVLAHWLSPHRYDIHICLTPDCRGSLAISAGRRVRDYLFDVIGAERLLATAPGYNPACLVFALRCGMKVEHRTQNEFRKNGQSYGAAHVVLDRSEWLAQPKDNLCPSPS